MSWTLLRVNISLKEFTVIGCEDNVPHEAHTFIGDFLFVVFLLYTYTDFNVTTVAYDKLELSLSCFSPLLSTNRLFLYAAYKSGIPVCCLQIGYSSMLPTYRLFFYVAYKSGIPVCCLQIGYSSTAVAKLPTLPAAFIKERVE